MTVTAASILSDFRSDIAAFEASTPRAQQTTVGASQLKGCTAAAIFRLRGAESDDTSVSWPAVVGKAIHAYCDEARTAVRPGIITETTFWYKGTPATIDYYDPAQRVLVDVKTKDTADEIAAILEDGESTAWRAQVQVGAMGLREDGHEVNAVAILVLPRNGNLDDAAVLGPWPVSEAEAIEGAEWAHNATALAADPDVDPTDYRGKPYFFCEAYCEFFTQCREPLADVELMAELEAPAVAYREAQDAKDAAEGTMKSLRPVLLGRSGVAGAVKVATSGGGSKTVEEVDTEALEETWRMVHGEDLPTKTVTKTTSQRLIVSWVK